MKRIRILLTLAVLFIAAGLQTSEATVKEQQYTYCDPELIQGPGVSFQYCYDYIVVYTGVGYYTRIINEYYKTVY